MIEPAAALSPARVLVAMDTGTLNQPALSAAAGVAAALGARLEGLFVENADLVRLGGLPFASEISAVTGAWRDLAVDEIERALRLQAARIERLLADAAKRVRVPWSFETARGRLVAQAIAREAELTILGGANRAAETASLLAVSRRAHPGRRSMAVLFDASPTSLRALEVAGRLADALGSDLRLLMPSGAPAQSAAIRDRAQAWLATEGRAGLALPLDAGEGALATALLKARSELLVHGVSDLTQSLQTLAVLVEQVSCPLLIVRVAHSVV